jgi:nitric oxide reductase NorD protein
VSTDTAQNGAARFQFLKNDAASDGRTRFSLWVQSQTRGENDHHHRGQTLEGVAPVLGLYYRALSGRNAAILPYRDQHDPEQFPDTHTTIRLPARVARFHSEESNFDWYKVALTHRAGHYEGGTFAFAFEREARHFARLRPLLVELERHEHESDLESFFRLFAQRELAVEIFTQLEALRIDEWVKRRYAGLRRAFDEVQQNALCERPVLEQLQPRDALAELLVRLTLSPHIEAELPALLREPLRQLVSLSDTLRLPEATVEDSAEATLRAYCIIVSIPNLDADYGPRVRVVSERAQIERQWPRMWPEPEPVRLEGDEVLAAKIKPVSYRDKLGSRYTFYRGAGPLDQQAIFRFTQADDVGDTDVPVVSLGDEERPKPPEEPMDHPPHDHFGEDEEEHISGELHDHEAFSHVYPEWDHVTQKYRRNWCRVRESRIESTASPRFLRETLHAYGQLVADVQRQFERISREGLRKLRRMPDGDELDLDAAIEAMIDLRMGRAPSDHVYVSRQRGERDVAVAFLVDKSSSTAEHVEPPAGIEVKTPHGRNYNTILDLEKESMVLLMMALERIGDRYGIYFFSGTGREDVKFHVLKDFDEKLGDLVSGRIDNIKPLHTTRMGPPIRHAVQKLRAQTARTKLLVLISDGRPFDLDYGQEYGEDAEAEYAIHDTRQALNEARRANITPLVLTIDPQGNDYLRTMCDGLDYEVLDDVSQLPTRLVSLYRALSS